MTHLKIINICFDILSVPSALATVPIPFPFLLYSAYPVRITTLQCE